MVVDMTPQPSQSFGAQADDYERGRPEYPADAVSWLIGDASNVLDVGAGTGKLTRVIKHLGRQVVAVEPDPGMRDQLIRTLPDVMVLTGAGEDLPLSDNSVDAITYGQAWHWVRPDIACAEAARVLRPFGVLGLVWNVRDQSADWVAQLTEVSRAEEGEARALIDTPKFTTPFLHAVNRRWTWSRAVSPEEVVWLMASRSSVISATDTERRAILEGVQQLLASHPDTAGRETIDLPYITTAWRLSLGPGDQSPLNCSPEPHETQMRG